jgi:hypothetical protein
MVERRPTKLKKLGRTGPINVEFYIPMSLCMSLCDSAVAFSLSLLGYLIRLYTVKVYGVSKYKLI